MVIVRERDFGWRTWQSYSICYRVWVKLSSEPSRIARHPLCPFGPNLPYRRQAATHTRKHFVPPNLPSHDGRFYPIAKFLERNPDGGIHHLCYEVDDIIAARDQLKAKGARVLGSGEPRIGAHGKPVLFLHPKDFCGTLVELEEA
jgi:catechol 2,3-dioxygenase-like lactoylglutathione lyase family enzyme